VRWLIADRTGWTLDYIDSLPMDDLLVGMQAWRGIAIARE
jgi:hypothetical protein